jgi:hypothetical protein
MATSITVSHYGVHWTPEDNIAYLHQGRAATNAVGLKEKTPFYVQLPRRRKPCNHQIALHQPVPDRTHWATFCALMKDQLVQAMLPVPNPIQRMVTYFNNTSEIDHHLAILSRLSSPIQSIIHHLWIMNNINEIADELQMTNVQPLVLIGAKPEHTELLRKIAEIAVLMPRRLIIGGTGAHMILPKNFVVNTTTIEAFSVDDLTVLPFEQLGATVLRRHMRHEILDAPMKVATDGPRS